jgi:hypothetical protein
MKGYIVQLKETQEYVNFQGLAVDGIKNAAIFSSEEDACAAARAQDCDTVVVPHEYVFTDNRAGTYYDYHRTF